MTWPRILNIFSNGDDPVSPNSDSTVRDELALPVHRNQKPVLNENIDTFRHRFGAPIDETQSHRRCGVNDPVRHQPTMVRSGRSGKSRGKESTKHPPLYLNENPAGMREIPSRMNCSSSTRTGFSIGEG